MASGDIIVFVKQAFNELIKTLKGGKLNSDVVTTSVTAGTYIALPDHPCTSVTFINDSGNDILLKLAGSTNNGTIRVFNSTYFTFDGLNTSSVLSITNTVSSASTITFLYNNN